MLIVSFLTLGGDLYDNFAVIDSRGTVGLVPLANNYAKLSHLFSIADNLRTLSVDRHVKSSTVNYTESDQQNIT